MKLTNIEALNAQRALGELGQRDDMPIRASLDIALISNMVDVQVKAYGVVLQSLYKKYSLKTEPAKNGGVRLSCIEELKALDKETKAKYDLTWKELAKKEDAETVQSQLIEENAEVARIVAKHNENLQAFSEKLNELLEANTGDMQFSKIKLPSDIKVKPEILKPLVEFLEIT